MDSLFPVLMTFGAFIIVALSIVRSRKRIKCLEIQLANKGYNQEQIKEQAVQAYSENNLIKLADHCRELEARVQNRALLLEKLLEQADEKIKNIQEPPVQKNIVSESNKENNTNPYYRQICELSENGINDREIASMLDKTEGEIKLLRSLGSQTN